LSLTITPLSNSIGAEVSGTDLSEPISPEDLANIKQALLDHLIMVVRDQSLNLGQLLTTVRLFGETM